MVRLLITLQRSVHKVTRALPGSYICDKPARWRNLRIGGGPLNFRFFLFLTNILCRSKAHTIPHTHFCYGRADFRSERQKIRSPYTRFPLPLYRKMAVAMPLNATATRSTSIKRFMPPKLRRTALGGMIIRVSYSLKQASELVCDIQTEIAARAVTACHLLHLTLTAVGKGYVAELLEHHLLTYDVLQTKFELEMAQGARE